MVYFFLSVRLPVLNLYCVSLDRVGVTVGVDVQVVTLPFASDTVMSVALPAHTVSFNVLMFKTGFVLTPISWVAVPEHPLLTPVTMNVVFSSTIGLML